MEQVVGIGVALVIFLFIVASILSWRLSALILLSVAFIDLHLFQPITIGLEEGVTLHSGDLFFGALAITTALRLFSLKQINRVLLSWLIFAIFLSVAFIHGVLAHGLLTAASSYRASFYLTVGVTYFASFEFDEAWAKNMLNLMIGFGMLIFLASLVLWFAPEWRPVDTERYAMSVNIYERNRALPAQAAMFAALAYFATFPAWLENKGSFISRAASLPLLGAAIMLFHRSVWVALAMGMIVMTLSMGRRAVRIVMAILATFLALAAIWLTLQAMDLDVISESLRTAVNEAVGTEDSTLTWRVQGWQILVDRAISDGPLSILFGSGFGIGFERTIDQNYVVVSPHNYFVELFLTSGLVGCGLFLAPFGLMLSQFFWRQDQRGDAILTTMLAILVASLTYAISYSPQYDSAPLIGLALSLAARSSITAPARS